MKARLQELGGNKIRDGLDEKMGCKTHNLNISMGAISESRKKVYHLKFKAQLVKVVC